MTNTLLQARSIASHSVLLMSLLVATTARADDPVRPVPPPGGQASIAPGPRYQAGWFKRWLLGDTYRNEWATPITVPVLDLNTYAGGLKMTKKSGGKQTASLRFVNAHGAEFVFRKVDKDHTNPPEGWKNTIIDWIARDQVSAHHPAGAVVSDVFLEAAGVIHASPKLAVMPDDPDLGEFREEFAGHLGMIEPYPNIPEDSTAFAGAVEVIDSDSLRVLLDRESAQQVDGTAYVTARLIDMFLNDWDRHEGNWMWARTESDGPWRPIPRDRDKVMIGYGGFVSWGHKGAPQLIPFQDHYANMRSYVYQGILLDGRLLAGVEAEVYDSVATSLAQRFTDDVIDRALHAMPAEYHASIPELSEKLRARRDALPQQAAELYKYFQEVVDIHGTDAPERATVTIIDSRHIEIEIRPAGTAVSPGTPAAARGYSLASTDGDGAAAAERPAPFYHRTFDAKDTDDIRLYMHGGDDRVDVIGKATPDTPIRIIGGNGRNQFNDSDLSEDQKDAIIFYDEGAVDNVHYADNPTFDRRPLMRHAHMERILPWDQGANSRPVFTFRAPGDLGLMPGVGLEKKRYGFRTYPYEYRLRALGEYATGTGGWRVTGNVDKRYETSRFHWLATARMSDVEVLNFYGFGNDTEAVAPEGFYEVEQREWSFFPSAAWVIGTRSDFMIGPVVKYSTTDSTGNFLSADQPYGFGDFGQAGIRLALFGDSRDHSRGPGRKVLLDVSATYYPQVWDVNSQFGVLNAITATYLTIPVPLRPILALKAGGKQVLGNEFPFHESAFVGGRPSDRGIPRERYAGDASLYGTAELRFPLWNFAFVLPWNFGVYTYTDWGRVYVDRLSPGGWHNTNGVGMWIGLNPGSSFTLESVGDGTSGLSAKIGLSF